MRKLVIAVIALLALFTFIREFSTSAEASGLQKAQTEVTQIVK